MNRLFGRILVALLGSLSTVLPAADRPSLELEAKVPLGDVRGRIDHLAADMKRERLFVAELGNNTIGVVDLKAKKTIRTLTGVGEPQGLGYLEATDTLYAASGDDGTLHLFKGDDLTPSTIIKLGSDADNVRIDRTKEQVIVGYGRGALGVIDATTQKIVSTISLKAHPESFQLDPSNAKVYVNVPNAHEIAVVDRSINKQIASWPTKELASNYPLAFDLQNQAVLAVFRRPPTLATFRTTDGQRLGTVNVCADSDDVFIDTKRERVYVICGEGAVDVLSRSHDSYQLTASIHTVSGARTGLFIPELDRIYVAVRASGQEPAAVWVLRPVD